MAVFERTIKSLDNLGKSTTGLWENVKSGFSQTFTSGKDGIGRAGGFVGGMTDRMASVTTKAVALPVKATSYIFKKAPVLATIGVVAAGATIVSGFFQRRAERSANMDMAELQAARQQAAMAQAQANTVTPAEYAAMEAQMRQGGQHGSFAAGLQAKSAAAVGPTV